MRLVADVRDNNIRSHVPKGVDGAQRKVDQKTSNHRVEGDLNIFQKEVVGSLVLGLCWAGVLTGSEEAIEVQSE